MTSMFSFSVCLSAFNIEKDVRLTENSYDTDKDCDTKSNRHFKDSDEVDYLFEQVRRRQSL